MPLVLKIVLALLQALPALLGLFNQRKTEQQRAEKTERIERDPVAEFEREFGSVSADERSTGTTPTSVSGTEVNKHPNDTPNAR